MPLSFSCLYIFNIQNKLQKVVPISWGLQANLSFYDVGWNEKNQWTNNLHNIYLYLIIPYDCKLSALLNFTLKLYIQVTHYNITMLSHSFSFPYFKGTTGSANCKLPYSLIKLLHCCRHLCWTITNPLFCIVVIPLVYQYKKTDGDYLSYTDMLRGPSQYRQMGLLWFNTNAYNKYTSYIYWSRYLSLIYFATFWIKWFND